MAKEIFIKNEVIKRLTKKRRFTKKKNSPIMKIDKQKKTMNDLSID